MKSAYLGWYLALAFATAAPVGIRTLSWRTPEAGPIDPEMAKAGETLFVHNWTAKDPLAHGGDGLGPVFNASSCVACHIQGGVGGAGGVAANVTTFTDRGLAPGGRRRDGVVHARTTNSNFQENLNQVNRDLPAVERPTLEQLLRIPQSTGPHCGPVQSGMRMPPGVHISQRNTPALYGAKLIDEIPEREIIAMERREQIRWALASSKNEEVPVGRAFRLPGGKIGRFGWKAQAPSLSEFVQAACANELGLSNPNHPQPAPLTRPDYLVAKLDLTQEQCDQITAFVASLPRPVERVPKGMDASGVERGKKLFSNIGCADCHVPKLGSVDGLYSDLLLHRMGQDLQGGGSYNDPPRPPDPEEDPSFEGQHPGEWRTPPLWGVADSGPYMHDGRAIKLEDAIGMHRGQGLRASTKFASLSKPEQDDVVGFLKSLRAPQ